MHIGERRKRLRELVYLGMVAFSEVACFLKKSNRSCCGIIYKQHGSETQQRNNNVTSTRMGFVRAIEAMR